jgi:hypothetical protein
MAESHSSRRTRRGDRRGGNRPRTHPAPTTDLHDILWHFAGAIALIRVAQRSLDSQEIAGDEVSALRTGLVALDAAYCELDLATKNFQGGAS